MVVGLGLFIGVMAANDWDFKKLSTDEFTTNTYGAVEELRDVVEGTGDNNYRVAYCSFEQKGRPVAPGTSATAKIRLGKVSIWSLLFQP